ncbi:hypothetical protein BMS3Abin04_00250 [bacterium BMS3Abin04]|nr:hypothetical protein BMS3Abin04_00250 [bacterium BMS3Abin04]
MNKNKKHIHPFRVIKVFIIYFLILVSIFLWIDYYSYEMFNPIVFISASFFVALISTIIHLFFGRKSEVDDLAKKL